MSSPGPFDSPTQAWTFRDWLLPWMQVALVATVAATSGTIAPSIACLSILASIPFLRRPARQRRWLGWVVLLGCGLWWGGAALAKPGGSLDELLRIGGWCLVLLASLQVLSLGRGGSSVVVGWCTMGATLAFAGLAGKFGYAIVGLQAVLLVESLRRKHSGEVRFGGLLGRWTLVLLVALGMSALVHRTSMGRWTGGGGRWMDSAKRMKGFSTISRLGTFGPNYLATQDGEVAVRVYGDSSPGRLKGMVHDLYAQGNWIAAPEPKSKEAERMTLDFSQFCRDAADLALPLAWAVSGDDRVAVLFAPPGTGCVGVVAENLAVGDAGVFRSPPEGVSRGWTWYRTQIVDTSTAPTDLAVPRELTGILDSTLAEILADSSAGGLDRTDRTKIVDAVFGFLHTGFRYDLDVPLVAGEDPLRTFLRVRRGYCEYYATAAVLILRRAGVPARYATGFVQPEPSGAGSWVYRREGAHAWAEWKPVDGNWQILDPLPASSGPDVAPSRSKLLAETVSGWMVLLQHRLRDGRWRERLDAEEFALEGQPWLLVSLVSLVITAGVFSGWWLRRKRIRARSRQAWSIRMEKAETMLRRQGHARSPSETIGAFLMRLPATAHPWARAELESYQIHRWASAGEFQSAKPSLAPEGPRQKLEHAAVEESVSKRLNK